MIWTCPKCQKLVKAPSEKAAIHIHKFGAGDCLNVRARPIKNHTDQKSRIKHSYEEILSMDTDE